MDLKPLLAAHSTHLYLSKNTKHSIFFQKVISKRGFKNFSNKFSLHDLLFTTRTFTVTNFSLKNELF